MDDEPPIHRAVHTRRVEEVLRLIHQDPQVVNSIDRWYCYPLWYACKGGHVSVVAALVDHGANIDYQDTRGRTAFFVACSEGHLQVVKLLIEKGADPTLGTFDGWTPLFTASSKGHIGVLRLLLQHSSLLSIIDSCDDDGSTALHIACRFGHPMVVKMLLEAGADPMQKTHAFQINQIPMDIAIEEGNQMCVILLKEWDRSYTITKARRLHDAFCRHQEGITIAAASASSSDDGDHANNKRPRVLAAIPTYLTGRVEGGQPLPKVEMVDGYEEGSLVESVLEYVICGDLKGDLFVELMEMMGKAGHSEGLEEAEEDDGHDEDSNDWDDSGAEAGDEQDDESEVEEEEDD